MKKALIISGVVLPTLLVALFAGVFATGQTFGQRCAAAFKSPLQQEKCIWRLDHGFPLAAEVTVSQIQ